MQSRLLRLGLFFCSAIHTEYSVHGIKKLLLESKDDALVLSTSLALAPFTIPCIGAWAATAACMGTAATPCPVGKDWGGATLCLTLITPGYDADGEFFMRDLYTKWGAHAMLLVGYNGK